jgi:hypothetical protein
MAKRKKAVTSAKKNRAGSSTPTQIRELWTVAAQRGLGPGKKFNQEILDEYFPQLEHAIAENLAADRSFDSVAKSLSTRVAEDIGKICRILTREKVVTKATFDAVLGLLRTLLPCDWCDPKYIRHEAR